MAVGTYIPLFAEISSKLIQPPDRFPLYKPSMLRVRCGETGHNKDNVIQGHLDVPLSPTGLHQADLLGRHLQHQQYTHIYASDLTRAKQTAESIMQQNQSYKGSIVQDTRLRERKFGTVEGKSFKYLKEAAGKANQPLSQFTPSGGETLQQVNERAVTFFQDLCQMVEGKGKNEMSEYISNGSSTNSDTMIHLESGDTSYSLNCQADMKQIGQKRKSESSENEIARKVECSDRIENQLWPLESEQGEKYLYTSSKQQVLTVSGSCEYNLNMKKEKLDIADKNNFRKSSISKKPDTTQNLDKAAELKNCSLSQIDANQSLVTVDGNVGQFSVSFADDVIRSHITSCCNDPHGNECPNVSLSPLVDHSLITQSAISGPFQERGQSNGQTERRLSVCSSCDDADSGPILVANILVVSHGGFIRELFRHFVEDLECTVPGGKKQALRLCPNAGLSKFTVSVEEHDGRPKIICHQIHDKQHLISELGRNNIINGDDIAL